MMAERTDAGRLNLNVPEDVKHWFAVAVQLRKNKMTPVLVSFMREYASATLTEAGLPDPFEPPKPKKRR